MELLKRVIEQVPEVLPYMSEETKRYLKAAPIPRDEQERRLAKKIAEIDKKYLLLLEAADGIIPSTFWFDYERELRDAIAAPLRSYIENSFTNYSDYVNFIDQNGAIGDIDTFMTRAINEVASSITANTRRRFEGLLAEGVTGEELIERMALRFSSGHAEQVAVTELTRAESYFSDALSARLNEQGLETQIRWQTAEDEKVCPICAPADHKLKDDRINTTKGGWNGQTWGNRFGRPPAHPNCRCQTVVELVNRKPNA